MNPFIKRAERQMVSPTMAGLSALLPFGAAVHGTVAGHSPREGLREEVGQAIGNTVGGVSGGIAGAALGGTAGHAVELAKGMSARELLLARIEALTPKDLPSANTISLAAAKARGLTGGALGALGGFGVGTIVGGTALGALGAALAARSGNKVVQENRIANSPLLSKVQDWLNQRAGK